LHKGNRQFTLGRLRYRTKSEAAAAAQRILHTAPLGQLLRGDDLDLAVALLDRHHDRENKLAGGMVGITVLKNNVHLRSRGFHIVRPDGSTMDFSYRVALDMASKVPTIEQACRNAVWPDIMAWRDMYLEDQGPRCEVSGELLTRDTMHVDHAGDWPFRRIIAEFVIWRTVKVVHWRSPSAGSTP
jgi:hypothetical protein